jgi:hypothetical protein
MANKAIGKLNELLMADKAIDELVEANKANEVSANKASVSVASLL